MTAVWAVVLAGGASRRFGSDKLEARLGAGSLLEHAVRELPAGSRLLVVGPLRTGLAADSPISYVREDPPGGGPAAAMIAGLIAVTGDAGPDDVVLVLPGDTPAAGRAAALLMRALLADPVAVAVVGVDDENREQSLQLALRRSAAERLILAAGDDRGHDASARVLIQILGDDLRRVPLPAHFHADIDTPGDLDRWQSS